MFLGALLAQPWLRGAPSDLPHVLLHGGVPGFLGFSRTILILGAFILRFFCFPGSILGRFWCQALLVWFCHILSNEIATTSRVHVLLQSLSNTASVHLLVVIFVDS